MQDLVQDISACNSDARPILGVDPGGDRWLAHLADRSENDLKQVAADYASCPSDCANGHTSSDQWDWVPRATGASAHHAGERVAGTSGRVRNRAGAGLAQFWQTREKSVMACLSWAGTLTVWH